MTSIQVENDLVGGWPVGSALLLTRASPHAQIAAAFDDWQRTKHLPELMGAPGVASVFYGTRGGVPSIGALMGDEATEHADRLAIYASVDLARMMTFVGSPQVADAISDGSQWFGQFHPLDHESYSGNVYRVTGSRGACLGNVDVLVVARLEIRPQWLPDFDDWALNELLASLLAVPQDQGGCIQGVRICSVHRDGIPVPHYHSRGNRAVLAAMSVEPIGASSQEERRDSPRSRTSGDDVMTRFPSILRHWGRRADYATLEIFERDTVLTSDAS